VVVNEALGDTGAGGDRGDGSAAQPMLEELDFRGVKDGGAGRGRAGSTLLLFILAFAVACAAVVWTPAGSRRGLFLNLGYV